MSSVAVVPPNVTDLERALLGYVLVTADFDSVSTVVTSKDFYAPENAAVWTACCAVHARLEIVGFELVRSELVQTKKLKAAGGEAYVIELTHARFENDSARTYARKIRDAAKHRNLIRSCAKLSSTQSYGEPFDVFLTKAQRVFRDITRHTDDENPANDTGLALVPLKSVVSKAVSWLWKGWIPAGMLTYFQGEQGRGKSTVLADIAARVSRGDTSFLQSTDPRPRGVLYIAMEDPLDCVLRPRLDAAGADVDRIFAVDSSADWFTVGAGMTKLANTIRANDIGLVVIDPIAAHLGNGTDSHKDASVRGEIAGLATVAAETGAAIVYVLHLRKSGGDAFARASGSIAFTALPRSGMALGPCPDDDTTLVLALAKHSASELQRSRSLRIISAGESSSRIEWIGESDATADEVCAVKDGAKPKKGGAVDRAVDLVVSMLSGGITLPSSEIFKRAKAEGIGRDAVYKAKDQLEIVPRKNGLEEWQWNLPANFLEEPDTQSIRKISDIRKFTPKDKHPEHPKLTNDLTKGRAQEVPIPEVLG
jgi:DNA repair protein RadA/Sms